MHSDKLKGENRVTLLVPQQKPAPEGIFLLNPKAVKRWIEDLPVANIGEMSKQIYKALTTFNRIRIPTLVRAEVVELFRDPVRYINTNITKHYMNVGFPLNPKANKASLLAAELCNELCIAYKILFLEQTLGDERHFNQKLIIVAAQRALQYMKQMMFHRWLTYKGYQLGVWREANYLYAWAYQNQVHQIGVKEDNKFSWRKKAVQSIEDIYLSIVLVATTQPYYLTQLQLRQIHDKLNQWVKMIEVKPLYEVNYNAGVFYVNLWSDDPPYKTVSRSRLRDRRYMAIDLTALINHLQQELPNARWESPVYFEKDRDQLSRSLINFLMQAWNKTLERKYTRIPKQSELEVIVGTANLVYLLKQDNEDDLDLEIKHSPKPSLKTPSKLTWNDSVFSSLSISPTSESGGGDSLFADTIGNHPIKDLEEPVKGRRKIEPVHLIFNENINGFYLGDTDFSGTRLKVGEILGIKEEDQYGLGVVRWLRYGDDKKLYLGVNLLADLVHVVEVSPEQAQLNQPRKTDCLLLASKDEDNKKHTLISYTHVFDNDTVLLMKTDYGHHKIKIERQLESNQNFVHYQFSYLGEEIDDFEINQTSIDDELADLWKEL